LALYHRRGRDSRPADADVVRICIDLAGIAIEHRRSADRIHHMAHHDELTGLPNRLLFNHFLRRALVRARAQKTPVAVMFLDLDRFKVINDTLGHKAGDEALCLVAERLVGCLTTTDSLARVGGDEFTLVVERFRDPQELAEVAQKLLGAAARSLVIDGHECHLSGSIGVSIFPDDGTDIAMYRAKAAGPNKFQFFSKEMNEHSVERLTLESELRHAVTQRQFAIHYQPKINVATGRITGAEALVRWQHPQRGLLPPGAFIGIAEEIGLIGAIGSQVLEAACKDARRWSEQGTEPLPVAINLSAVQFDDPRLLDDLDCVLVQTGFDPFQLEVEITETAMMADPEKAMKLLEKIRERGIGVAIDDFGMGHSSLAYLKRFPADTLKIDRAFVRDIVESQNDLAIATAIIAMGHTMGMKVIAEGVETREQLEILQRCGCDDYQGFLFSPAVTAAEFQQLLLAKTERTPRHREVGEPVVDDVSAALGHSGERRRRS
jgi:diguanylate cyclase (GGDEF)-like protein